jgi:virginiamycin A acetyltransferase
MLKSKEDFIQDQIIRCSHNYDQIYNLFGDEYVISGGQQNFALLYDLTVAYLEDKVSLLGKPFSNIEYHNRFGWTISRNQNKAYLGKVNLAGMSEIDIGNKTYFSGSSTINGNNNLSIGSYCSLADGIEFFTSNINHPTGFATTYNLHSNSRMVEAGVNIDLPKFQKEIGNLNEKQNITVGNDVWIGRDVMIMNGIKIPDGCIIGARSTVLKDCEPYGVYVGTPARLVKYRFSNEIINQLLELRWWNWSMKKVKTNKLFFDTDLNSYSGNIAELI